ncbi:hypothetical protein Tsubulata_016196 [Turnera subulata]|uniref:DUF4283 domain-containing protein n=1 Tax=Turnera subulata TaxID=218843 RepID=A0A9Q0JP02_9ROSI|nr:hypothetical protein Tsubulata_016196 [Turnera subulata]
MSTRAQQQDPHFFADVVRPAITRNNNVMNESMTFVPKDGSFEWLQRSIYGVLKTPMPLGEVSDLFSNPESGVSNVIPLGGVAFLNVFESKVHRQNMINDPNEELLQAFETFRSWKEGDGAHNRLCWIVVIGVPPNAWTEEFFQVIMSSVGVMVEWSPLTCSRTRMDVAEILILIESISFINKVLQVKFRSHCYEVGILECQYDPFDWVRHRSPINGIAQVGINKPDGEDSDHDTRASTPQQQPQNDDPSSPNNDNQPHHTPDTCAHQPTQTSSGSEDPFELRPII